MLFLLYVLFCAVLRSFLGIYLSVHIYIFGYFVAILLLLEFRLGPPFALSFSSFTAASSIRILGLPPAPPSYVVSFAYLL